MKGRAGEMTGNEEQGGSVSICRRVLLIVELQNVTEKTFTRLASRADITRRPKVEGRQRQCPMRWEISQEWLSPGVADDADEVSSAGCLRFGRLKEPVFDIGLFITLSCLVHSFEPGLVRHSAQQRPSGTPRCGPENRRSFLNI